MWIARNKDNSLYLSILKPKLVHNSVWLDNHDYMELPNDWFSNLKWGDEPIEVSIIETFRLQSLRAIK